MTYAIYKQGIPPAVGKVTAGTLGTQSPVATVGNYSASNTVVPPTAGKANYTGAHAGHGGVGAVAGKANY